MQPRFVTVTCPSVDVVCIESTIWISTLPLQSVYGDKLAPYYTLEGGSVPLVSTLQNELKDKPNVLLLPMGRSNDGAQ